MGNFKLLLCISDAYNVVCNCLVSNYIYTTTSFSRHLYLLQHLFKNVFVDLHQRPNKCRHFIHFTFHFKYIKASLINGTFESYIQKHQKLKFSNLKNIHVRGKLKSFAFMTVMDGAERWRVKRKYISMAYPLWSIKSRETYFPCSSKYCDLSITG